MNRLSALHLERASARKRKALACAACVVDGGRERGISISVVGSLNDGSFGLHSDVDLFVHGATGPEARVAVERLAADAFRDSGLPYDLIYESDLSPERVKEFLDA